MSRFRFQITMTLDGFVAGPNQSVANPLGEGGSRIHDWAYRLKSFRELHGDLGGGETGVNDDVLHDSFANLGATIMGRNMFGGGPGPWSDPSWNGWWRDDPPFHTPVFVLTHHPRDPLAMKGGTTFHFVTEGIESALARAREAAGERDVALGGGADVAQQYLAAGLIDEVQVHLVPVLLGGGARLFDNLGGADVKLEPIRVIAGPGVAHLAYRVVK
jgi:dihydrofolate reductase